VPLASEEEVLKIVCPEDQGKEKPWWRCKGCKAFLYSEIHHFGCKYSAVVACSLEDVVESTAWQSQYDPNKKARNRADITITCKDCHQGFLFTEQEQKFFAKQGFSSAPVRCVQCRRGNKVVKAERIEQREKRKAEGNVVFGGPDKSIPMTWGAVAKLSKEKMGYVHVPKVRNSEFERTPFKPHTTKAVHHMN